MKSGSMPSMVIYFSPCLQMVTACIAWEGQASRMGISKEVKGEGLPFIPFCNRRSHKP